MKQISSNVDLIHLQGAAVADTTTVTAGSYTLDPFQGMIVLYMLGTSAGGDVTFRVAGGSYPGAPNISYCQLTHDVQADNFIAAIDVHAPTSSDQIERYAGFVSIVRTANSCSVLGICGIKYDLRSGAQRTLAANTAIGFWNAPDVTLDNPPTLQLP